MGFAEKYNKFNSIFDIDIKDFAFMDGYDFIEKYGDNVVKIDGLYINKKGMFNDHPVAIMVNENVLLDLPSHMTDVVNDILADAESIDLIKKGLVGLKAHEYVDSTYHKRCVGFEWCDL
nr:MAG TPA: putative single-stranded DNA-binding protein [Caudoviricetes sp.]